MYQKLILYSLLSFTGTLLFAQKQVVFDTAFLSKQYNPFFKQHPSVKKIIFHYGKEEIESIRIVNRNDPDEEGRYYDGTFEGDRYLFTKAYGAIDPPNAWVNLLSAKGSRYYRSTSFQIVPDTIHAQLRYIHLLNPDEPYFEKVEVRIQYPRGLTGLQTTIQQSLRDKNIVDSAFLFRGIVNTDSTMRQVEVMEGNDPLTENIIREIVRNSGPWIPCMQGGRFVKSYARLFVRVYPSGTIRLYVRGIQDIQ